MALPLRCKNPPESFPFATVALIVLNVVVYIATSKDGLVAREDIVQRWGIKGSDFTPLRMLTSMFLHGGPMHLIGNMWFLALFGFAVEGRLKWYRFLPLYLLAGVGGDVLDYLISGKLHPDLPSIGASGAIFGVVGAALWMFPHAKVTVLSRWGERGDGLGLLFPVSDWSLWIVALYYLGFELLYAMLALQDGIGHLAHLGGALVGLLVCIAFRPHRDSETASQSKATLAEVKDLGVLGKLELAELHQGNPSDVLITLHWMDKSLRDAFGPNQACVDAFFKALPQMRRELDPRVLATPILGLAAKGLVKAREMVSIAGDLERATDNVNALRLYECAYGAPDSTDADQETACFRSGLLLENVVHNRDRAAACYAEVLHRWPMGPFAQGAQTRLDGIKARVKV